jgi:hypothetical protein
MFVRGQVKTQAINGAPTDVAKFTTVQPPPPDGKSCRDSLRFKASISDNPESLQDA